jgi:SAM-dependent methyltransferase
MNWIVYNELAWVDQVLGLVEDSAEEALIYIEALKKHFPEKKPDMLHLGCGAGGHDFHFKEHFTVTGIDLSGGMLEIARKTNPEINYLQGDMRTVELGRKFDIVIIPDSIAYMTTIDDLRGTLQNCVKHLNEGGVLLVVIHTREEFRNNNFAYTGEKDGVHVTVLENNHIISDSSYEASLFYLIRRDGKREIFQEVHTLGLFPYEKWQEIFQECGLKMEEQNLDHLYEPYLLNEGEYKLKMLIGSVKS